MLGIRHVYFSGLCRFLLKLFYCSLCVYIYVYGMKQRILKSQPLITTCNINASLEAKRAPVVCSIMTYYVLTVSEIVLGTRDTMLPTLGNLTVVRGTDPRTEEYVS